MPFDNFRNLHNEDAEKYVFRINGSADVSFDIPYRNDPYPHYEPNPVSGVAGLVSSLNDSAPAIARDIESQIAMQIPQASSISVDIRFSEGSLLIMGTAMLSIMNMVSNVEGTVGFLERISNIIHSAVNNSMRESVERRGAMIQKNTFRLNIVEPVVFTVANRDTALNFLREPLREQAQISRLMVERLNAINYDLSRLITLGKMLVGILVLLGLLLIFR